MRNKNSITLAEEEIALEKEKKVHKTNSLSGLMKAVQIHQYGGADKLIYEVAPIPKPAEDEVLIRVHAAGVNPIDWKIREGYLKDNVPHKFPFIPGWDVAGTVIRSGILVTRFSEGDLVFAKPEVSRNGCYAEYVSVKSKDTAFAPKSIPAYIVAGVPLASQTAWTGLFEIGNLKPNQAILIHGASGGVGTFAVQLAKIAGAHVIATTSGPNLDMVKSLGADEVIDYQKDDFSKKVKNINMVFDTIGGETQERSWKVLRKKGILVSTVGVDENAAAMHGVVGKSFTMMSNGARLQDIAGLIDKRMLRVVIDKEFSLETVQKAHELSQSGKARGKIILRIYDNPKE